MTGTIVNTFKSMNLIKVLNFNYGVQTLTYNADVP